MKLKLFVVTIITAALCTMQVQAAKVRMVATLTDLADLTRNVA